MANPGRPLYHTATVLGVLPSRVMGIGELELALARSGLSDDDYTAAVGLVRYLTASAAAADDLARAVGDADHYLPDAVVAALGRYRYARIDGSRVAA